MKFKIGKLIPTLTEVEWYGREEHTYDGYIVSVTCVNVCGFSTKVEVPFNWEYRCITAGLVAGMSVLSKGKP